MVVLKKNNILNKIHYFCNNIKCLELSYIVIYLILKM